MEVIRADDLCGQVLAMLTIAEMHALGFSRHNGLACPPGCSDCCRNDKPEDSVLSALPAGLWAVDCGLLELLEQAASERPLGPCVFYGPSMERPCSIYPLRPLICRLFGFAGKRDKHGTVQYRPCSRMTRPLQVIQETPPVFSDHATRIEFLYPPLGRERLPLNVAFYKAAQWILLRRQYDPEDPQNDHPPVCRPPRSLPRAA
ncbi:MAG: YkgJ family cysteine cluster protein [bacterium]